ncbi:MAG: hypothetical protein E6Q76_14400 [Rhizobium sp.]|nr:MAG: hypothetical protein E6Q76_14400 [Rhizobium sp.]
MSKQKVDLRISVKKSAAEGSESIEVSVLDQKSGVTFLQVSLSAGEYAKAFLLEKPVALVGTINELQAVGKKRECKMESVIIERTQDGKALETLIRERVRALEVDGWKYVDGSSRRPDALVSKSLDSWTFKLEFARSLAG